MRKLSLGMSALVLVTLTQVSFAEANVSQPQELNNVKQIVNNNNVVSQQLFNSACDTYVNLHLIDNSAEGSKMYAKAISDISKACALEPTNTDYLLLCSQIWRAKGGISYAKRYFSNAEAIMLKKLEVNPNDIAVNLDYAIASYAGDVRFWSDYSAYKNKAKKHAEKVINLCEAKLKKEENSNLIRIMAIANLVLDEQDKSKELIVKAKQMDSEDKGFSLWKFLGFEVETIERKTVNIFYADLFENTVDKKQWLWDVDTTNVDKEFLLYYLTDEARNNNL